ncbi:RAB-interacting protein [Strigomonas culicis]|uniref:PRA1 family protein n=1 Tax=Strigomonas culicis TaxID=28005 RepID=S9WA75_9TRYP|nr:RAB-interacting protein [Strigomonas culicis]|eukprot:EPY32860.1 RAB-interacting protein [Strigomonas culicis]
MQFVDSGFPSPNTAGAGGGYQANNSNMHSPAPPQNQIPSYFSVFAPENSHQSLVEKSKMVYTITRRNITVLFASVRPWDEFFDRHAFCYPAGLSDVLGRLSRNGNYFYSNYLILSLLCSILVLLQNLNFLVCMLICAMLTMFVRSRGAALQAAAAAAAADGEVAPSGGSAPIFVLFKKEWSASQCYVVIVVFGLLSFYICGGSSIMFWLLLTTFGVSSIHMVLRRPSEHSDFQNHNNSNNNNMLYQYA